MVGQFDQKNIAHSLKELCIKNGLTQQLLADLLFCDIRQVRRYETVGTDKLSIINLYASIFKISALSILSESF